MLMRMVVTGKLAHTYPPAEHLVEPGVDEVMLGRTVEHAYAVNNVSFVFIIAWLQILEKAQSLVLVVRNPAVSNMTGNGNA
jgi:hypothetical protein